MNNISEGFSVSGQPKTSLVKGNYGLPIIDTTPKSSEPPKITLEPTPEPRVTPIDDTDIKTIDVKEEKEKVKPWASAKIKSNVKKLNKIKQGIENYTVKQIAKIALKACEFENANLQFIKSMPNGQMRKDIDIRKLKKILPSFKPILLKDGIREIYLKKNKEI